MTKKRLLALLCFASTCFTIGLSAWVTQTWGASDPQVTLAVKGVSTEPLSDPAPVLKPTLDLHPTLAVPPGIQIHATEYALLSDTGELIYSSQPMDEVPIASVTKMMTALLATKYGSLSDILTVSQQGGTITGSLMGIYPGERISVESCLYGMMLVSGNDCAYTMGEYVGGILLHDPTASSEAKVAREVEEMNREATTLHLEHTLYKDPVGLIDAHSTAFDQAKLLSVAFRTPILRKIMGTADITVTDQAGHPFLLHNSNRLLEDMPFPGIQIGKTGYTDAAGHCLAAAATIGGHTYFATVLHTDINNNDASAIEMTKLLNLASKVSWE